MQRFIVLIIVVCAMTACQSNNDRDNLAQARDAYSRNLAKWGDADIHDYQFIYNTYCFCVMLQNVVIVVQQDKVTSAFYQASGEYLPDNQLAGLPTIDSLFNIIEDAINRNAYRLTASYNDDYGYPAEVSIDYEKNTIDEEFGFSASNLM